MKRNYFFDFDNYFHILFVYLQSETIKGEYMSTELMKQQIADYFKTQPVLKA